RLAEANGNAEDLLRAYAFLTDTLTMLARPRESAAVAEAGLDAVGGLGIDLTTLSGNHVEALVACGEWDRADAASAALLRRRTGIWPHQRFVNRAALDVGRGDFDAARALLEVASATVLEDERGLMAYLLAVVDLALSERRWADAEETVADG